MLMLLESVLEERQKLGQRLADKIILLNSYYDGYPRYMVKGPFPGQKIITHHCKLRVDACDWLICGAIRHFVYRWKLRDWEKSPCPVHDMTTDQLARGLSEIVFPKYSTGTETYHACSPSSSKIAADIKQELDSLRGLDLLAFQQ